MRGFRATFVLLGCAAIAIAACGINVVGASGDETTDGGTESGSSVPPKPGNNDDDGGAIELEGGNLEGSDADVPDGETPVEVVDSGGDAACVTAISDSFASGTISAQWTSYGGVDTSSANNNNYARLIPLDTPGKAAGLFWVLTPNVKATSFTAKYSYYARTDDKTDIGDGITFTWITAKDANPIGTNAASGAGLGLQPGISGYSFAFDSYQNSGIADTYSPSFSILKIDPARGGPGSYDWHVVKSGGWTGVYDLWRPSEVTVTGGKVSTKVTSTHVFDDVNIGSSNILAIGFTASTGGVDPIAYFVDTVSITLTDATCN